MSERDSNVALAHMLTHAREALAFVEQRSREEAESDRLRWHGLVRLLEIVGEAASRVAPAVRARHPSIPWPSVVGMRNRLIHAYDAVDNDIVWKVLRIELPSLIKEIERALAEERP